MENYEKKYKEALEKARQLCAYPTTKPFISDLQDLFPELKESEDEKVRKWLIDWANAVNWSEQFSVTREQALAWLEKRGEKPAEWSEEDINMIDWLIRCCEEEHKELCNDKYGHQDIVSDLKRDCRKKWDWLESLKNRVAPLITWKPSDEQIKVCKEVYADILSAKGFDLGTVLSEMNRMEEQLKKLKEE